MGARQSGSLDGRFKLYPLFLLHEKRPPLTILSLFSPRNQQQQKKTENVQPFDEGAAQVQRLLKRDRLELLGEGDSLEDFISASEFADDDGDQGAPAPSSSSSTSSSSPASASASASAPIPKAAAVPVSPFGATPTSPFGGNAPGNKNAAGVDSASLGGGLRGSVFGSGGAAGSPFAAGGMPTSQGASGLYNEAERMPGEMNRGLFGEGDESFNISRNAKDEGEDFSKLPWWSGITLSQVVIAGSFLFTISLMLATAWFVNSVGAIRFNE